MGSGTSVPHQMGSGTSVPKRRYLQIFKVKLFLAGCIVVHDLTDGLISPPSKAITKKATIAATPIKS